MITKLKILHYLEKTARITGMVLLGYAGYALLVYMAWTDIKPWSGVAECHDVCEHGVCGCSYFSTLYNESIFLIGLSPSWAVLPYLGHIFPSIT